MKKILKEYMFFLEFDEKKKYNTIISVKNDLEKFLDYFIERDINRFTEISLPMVKEYLKTNVLSSKTFNRKISSIKKFFKYLKDKSLIKENIALFLESDILEENEVEYLTYYEISKIREVLKTDKETFSTLRDNLIFELFYSSGLTLNELLNLDEANFLLEDREIHLLKNSKRKILFFSKRAKNIFLKFQEAKRNKFLEKDSSLIFLNNSGKKLTDRSVRRILEKYGIKAKIQKKLNPYTIRHTFCINLLKAGMPKEYLKKMLDIKLLDTFNRYEKIIKKENLWLQKVV